MYMFYTRLWIKNDIIIIVQENYENTSWCIIQENYKNTSSCIIKEKL